MDPTHPADLAALYQAAGIEPHVSTREAAAHLAHLVAENTRLTAEIDKQTLLAGMGIDQGATRIDVIPTREVVINWVLAAREMLGGGENYGESVVGLPPSAEFGIGTAGERYIVTVQRQGKLTPHQARLDAQAQRDRIRDAVLAYAYQEDLAAKVRLAHNQDLAYDMAYDKRALDKATAINSALSAAHAAAAQHLRQIAAQA